MRLFIRSNKDPWVKWKMLTYIAQAYQQASHRPPEERWPEEEFIAESYSKRRLAVVSGGWDEKKRYRAALGSLKYLRKEGFIKKQGKRVILTEKGIKDLLKR